MKWFWVSFAGFCLGLFSHDCGGCWVFVLHSLGHKAKTDLEPILKNLLESQIASKMPLFLSTLTLKW